VLTAKIREDRGQLVGALIVALEDEVYAITSAGGVIRTRAEEVRQAGRGTLGVRLMNLAGTQTVVGIARNAEAEPEDDLQPDDEPDDENAGDVAVTESPDDETVGQDGSGEPDAGDPADAAAEDDES
jgi:DNA gyrase subunit A